MSSLSQLIVISYNSHFIFTNREYANTICENEVTIILQHNLALGIIEFTYAHNVKGVWRNW